MAKKHIKIALHAVKTEFPGRSVRLEPGGSHLRIIVTDGRGHEHHLSLSSSPGSVENNVNHMRQKARRLRASPHWHE